MLHIILTVWQKYYFRFSLFAIYFHFTSKFSILTVFIFKLRTTLSNEQTNLAMNSFKLYFFLKMNQQNCTSLILTPSLTSDCIFHIIMCCTNITSDFQCLPKLSIKHFKVDHFNSVHLQTALFNQKSIFQFKTSTCNIFLSDSFVNIENIKNWKLANF